MSRIISNILKFLTFIFIIVLFFLFTKILNKSEDEQVKMIREEFLPIEKTNKDQNGIIKNLSIGNKYINGKGIYLELSNGNKYVIYGDSYNFQYKKPDLRDNLQINDSIYYKYDNDELFIYKKPQTLYFKLFRRI